MERSSARHSTTLLFIGLLFLPACSPVDRVTDEKPGTYDIAVTEIVVKSVEEEMSATELWFSVKVLVTNNTAAPRRVVIGIQGIDREGFELKDFLLRSSFGPNETKFLTDRQHMLKENFQKVVRWQVETIFSDE